MTGTSVGAKLTGAVGYFDVAHVKRRADGAAYRWSVHGRLQQCVLRRRAGQYHRHRERLPVLVNDYNMIQALVRRR